jgi:hypothetical protein
MSQKHRRTRSIVAKLGRATYKPQSGRLNFTLPDRSMTLWYACHQDYADQKTYRLQNCPDKECDFEWTYDVDTGEILKGPRHIRDDSSEGAPPQDCCLL